MALIFSAPSRSIAEDGDTPNATTAKSLEKGYPLDVTVWKKAVDLEILALDEARDSEKIAELKSFKITLENEEKADKSGDHYGVKEALRNLKDRYPVQRRHIIKYVNDNGS